MIIITQELKSLIQCNQTGSFIENSEKRFIILHYEKYVLCC